MNPDYLKELLDIYPDIKELSIGCSIEKTQFEILAKFKNLETLEIDILYGTENYNVSKINEFLKVVENSKISSFQQPYFLESQEQATIENFELIFKKFDLTSFQNHSPLSKDCAFKISDYLQKTTKLDYLSLSDEFSFGSLDLIFNALFYNKTVDTFSINYSGLNLQSDSTLEFIKYTKSITHLDMNNIEFTENQIKIFDKCLKESKTINHLDLSYTNYKGDFSFLQNKNIKVLVFEGIWNEYENIKENFIFELQSNSSLIELNIRYCHDETFDIEDLIDVLKAHPKLKILDLSEIPFIFKSNEMHRILESETLTSINFSLNYVKGNDETMMNDYLNTNYFDCNLGKLGNCLEDLCVESNSLKKINLNHNFINLMKNPTFLKSIFSLPKLEHLEIINNNLGKKGVELLSEILESNQTLTYLSIYETTLLNVFEVMKIFKDSLNKNSSLTKLSITDKFYFLEEAEEDALEDEWFFNPYVKNDKYQYCIDNACLSYLLTSEWSKTVNLKEIQLQNCENDEEVVNIFKDFFSMNTKIEEISGRAFTTMVPDISESLEFNAHLKSFDIIYQPKVMKILNRNEMWSGILGHFKYQFTEIHSFNVHFKF
eukprot:gene11602-4845_t